MPHKARSDMFSADSVVNALSFLSGQTDRSRKEDHL